MPGMAMVNSSATAAENAARRANAPTIPATDVFVRMTTERPYHGADDAAARYGFVDRGADAIPHHAIDIVAVHIDPARFNAV
jgi:hypothetical protein